jgi:DNA-binding NarL/FixJ family response regulator
MMRTMTKARVYVHAPDPLSQAGLAAQLRARPEVVLVEELPSPDAVADGGATAADVAVISVDVVDESAVRRVRALQRTSCPWIVLIVPELDEVALFDLVQEGVIGIVRRREASAERLVEVIGAARSGSGMLPPDMLGALMRRMKQVQEQVLSPHGLTPSGLTTREAEVLRLVGDGLDTREIATKLAYSERTIKNVIQDIVRRFGLRNRYHALAYALRQGLI